MAGVKALRTIAENITKTGKVVRSGDELVNLDPSAGRGTLGAITDLAEYDKVAGDLERLNEAPVSPNAVRQEIGIRQAQEAENQRRNSITSPGAELRLDHQTQSPEEFTERLTKQLRDPQFASTSVLKRKSTVFEEQIKASQEAHKAVVDRALGGLRQNPRWVSRSDEWIGDSPYKGDLLFHVDRQTDPLRPDSFVQFENPREIGLHAGTNAAAEGIIKRGGVEGAIKDLTDQAAAVKQIADELDLPLANVEATFGRATERHFRKVFGGGKFTGNIWEEVDSLIDEFLDAFGANKAQAAQFVQGMKDLPTPNTTPLLFRGRNGLLLEDTGGFNPQQVANQLERIFNSPEDIDIIEGALQAGDRAAQTQSLTSFIEEKGFDHIVYHNSVEDKGSLSIINWNPDLQRTPWHPDFTRDNPIEAAKQASAYVLSILGIGSGAVREE
jgi:hypothetical protein